jgi:hypothetical protein
MSLMLAFTKSAGTALTAGLLLAALAMLWWVAVPGGMAPASLLLIGLVLTGLVLIGRLKYLNSQDTGSLAHMLHETERVPAVVRPLPTPGRGSRP